MISLLLWRDKGADTLRQQQQVQLTVADSLLQTPLCSDAAAQTSDTTPCEEQTAVRGERRAVNAGTASDSKHLAIAVSRGTASAEQAGSDQAEAVKAGSLVTGQDVSAGAVKAGGSRTEAVKAISAEAQLHESTALNEQEKSVSDTNSRRAADESQVGDANQTLLGAPYTGSCCSVMCPAVSVPKCHDERVSSGADGPLLGEVRPDCEFIRAWNSTQDHEVEKEQVGGVSVSSRKRVESCYVLLSTVGNELSNRVSDSQEASDRAAMQTARSHGFQRKADGIRMSRVSIVADGPISGPNELCKECSTQQQPMQDSDKVGDVVKAARTLVDVSPCVSGIGYIRELELSAAESSPSECTGCCDARTNT